MKLEYSKVLSLSKLTKDVYCIVLETTIAKDCNPGQFINIYLENGTQLLPRPISICEIISYDRIRIAIANVGKGTNILSNLKPFDNIKILGPLGNGFQILDASDKTGQPLLIGGGIGIAPLLEVGKTHLKKHISFNAILGYRDEVFLEYDFEKAGCKHLFITTESGNKGRKGNVLDCLTENLLELNPSIIYACGPKPMLKALCEFCLPRNIPIQISLEERMACGIGACLSCVCHIKDTNGNTINKRLCKDGPVFLGTEVEWQ